MRDDFINQIEDKDSRILKISDEISSQVLEIQAKGKKSTNIQIS